MPYICLLQEGVPNLPGLIEKAQRNNYSVIAVPLNSHDLPMEFQRESLKDKQTKFTYSDLILTADQWNCKVITILSEHIDCDSDDEGVRKHSIEVLKRDISWTEHLQYGGYTMMKLKKENNFNLATTLTNKSKGE